MSSRIWCAFLLSVPAVFVGAAACGGSAFERTGDGGSSSTAGSSGTFGVAGSSNGGSATSGGTTSSGGTSSVGGTASGGSGGADITSCTENSQCQVVSAKCCSCGSGPISDYTAINSQYASVYSKHCGAIDCVACPPRLPDPNDPSFYYVPTCVAGQCQVVDLKTTDVTACTADTDCVTRDGTGCCPSCLGGNQVTLNGQHESELFSLVCDGGHPLPCPKCAEPVPTQTPSCQSGRCVFAPATCTSANPCP